MPAILFPDVNDRTINKPAVIIGPKTVLALYNAGCGTQLNFATSEVRDWLVRAALDRGWYSAEFVGAQLVLTARLEIESSIPKKRVATVPKA